MPGIIESQWLDYRRQVIPSTAPSVQVIESRRAFYAGARALLTGMLERFDPGRAPTAEDLAIMDGIKDELERFNNDVQTGRA